MMILKTSGQALESISLVLTDRSTGATPVAIILPVAALIAGVLIVLEKIGL